MSKIFEQGEFAVSKAGHDKKHLYMIVNEDERYVYLVDGVNKTLEKPKKKNKKHIQIIHFCDNPENKKTLDRLTQLLVRVRKVEKYHSEREYIPRVREE